MKANSLLLILLIGMISFTGLGHNTTALSKNSNVVTQSDCEMTKVVVIGYTGVGISAEILSELNENISFVEIESLQETKSFDLKIVDLFADDDYMSTPDLPVDNHPRQLHQFDKNLNVPFHPCPTYRKARDSLKSKS